MEQVIIHVVAIITLAAIVSSAIKFGVDFAKEKRRRKSAEKQRLEE